MMKLSHIFNGSLFLVIFMRILLVHIVNLFCFFSSSKAYLPKKKEKKLRFHIISFYVIDNQLPSLTAKCHEITIRNQWVQTRVIFIAFFRKLLNWLGLCSAYPIVQPLQIIQSWNWMKGVDDQVGCLIFVKLTKDKFEVSAWLHLLRALTLGDLKLHLNL
jgi:hypothetical protein